MKRISLLFICLITLIIGSFNNDKFTQLCSFYNDATLSFFCENYIEPPNEIFNAISNGNGYIIQTRANKAKETLKFLSNCSGFMLTFNGTKEDVKALLNEIKIIKIEFLNDIETYYAYSCGLLYSTMLESKKVNLQIAINRNIITIGSPIILGSY